jgi:hypothetical protein
MNRRKFAAVAGFAAAGALSSRAQTTEKSRFLTLDTWQLKNGSEPTRLNDWLGNNLVPAVSKLSPGPVLVLEAVFAPRVPQIMMLTGYSSFEQIAAAQDKLSADPALKAAYDKIEAGAEPLYEGRTTSILEPTPYSPAIAAEKRDKPRYFEVRIYHAPTDWQFRQLHERMLGPVSKLFKVHGIEPLFYSTTRIGPNMPNITYMIPWESLGAREKAWDAFGADPEWVKARKDSIDRGGQIVTMNDIEIYRATAYSPIK